MIGSVTAKPSTVVVMATPWHSDMKLAETGREKARKKKQVTITFYFHRRFNTNEFPYPHTRQCYRSLNFHNYYVSRIIRKLGFCLRKNKAADQLCSNCTADQRLCFCYMYSTIPLLLKSKISSLQQSSEAAQSSLCLTWSEISKPVFSRRGSCNLCDFGSCPVKSQA